jgi:hypothetical protein
MSLAEFLNKDEFTHDREAMLMHKLVFDCRLALAKLDSPLQVLTGEVDHNGFDVVFDDGDISKQFQVKTAYGSTATWEIHKRLLRPTSNLADYFGYETSPQGIGLCGGVILQELDVTSTNDLTVRYRYTDLNILRAFNLGIIKRKNGNSNKAVTALFSTLKKGYGTIAIPRGAFLEASGPAELLALAGFNTTQGVIWPNLLHRVSALHGGFVLPREIKLPTTEEKTKELIREGLLKLTPERV